MKSLLSICYLTCTLLFAAQAAKDPYCAYECPTQKPASDNAYYYPQDPRPCENPSEIQATVYDSKGEKTSIQIKINYAHLSIVRSSEEFEMASPTSLDMSLYSSTLEIDDAQNGVWSFRKSGSLMFTLNLDGPLQRSISTWWISEQLSRVYLVYFVYSPTLVVVNLQGQIQQNSPVNSFSESGWPLQTFCDENATHSITVFDTEQVILLEGYPCCSPKCGEYWAYSNASITYIGEQAFNQYLDQRSKALIGLNACRYCADSTLTVTNYTNGVAAVTWEIPVSLIPGNVVEDWVWALVGTFCGLVVLAGAVAVVFVVLHHQRTVTQYVPVSAEE